MGPSSGPQEECLGADSGGQRRVNPGPWMVLLILGEVEQAEWACPREVEEAEQACPQDPWWCVQLLAVVSRGGVTPRLLVGVAVTVLWPCFCGGVLQTQVAAVGGRV